MLLSPVASIQAQILNPLFGLYETGVTNFPSTSQPDGSSELHYTLIGGPITGTPIVADSAGGFPIPPWLPDSPSTGSPCDSTISRWIAPIDNIGAGVPAGTYRYQTTFDLTGFDLNTVSINGCWSTDNEGIDILLNGGTIGAFSPNFLGWSPFSVFGAFNQTINTLDFDVTNFGGPGGLRVTWTALTGTLLAVPEPSSLALFGLALIGLGAASRRRSWSG